MGDQPTWQVGIWLSGYWSLPSSPRCIPGSLSRSRGCPSAAFIVDTAAVFLVGDVFLNMAMLFGFVVSCVLYVMLVLHSLAAVHGGDLLLGDSGDSWQTLLVRSRGLLLYASEQGA